MAMARLAVWQADSRQRESAVPADTAWIYTEGNGVSYCQHHWCWSVWVMHAVWLSAFVSKQPKFPRVNELLQQCFSKQVIKERKAEFAAQLEKQQKGTVALEDIDEEKPLNIGQRKRLAFLDMLLYASHSDDPLSDDDIREEVDTFMFEVWCLPHLVKRVIA